MAVQHVEYHAPHMPRPKSTPKPKPSPRQPSGGGTSTPSQPNISGSGLTPSPTPRHGSKENPFILKPGESFRGGKIVVEKEFRAEQKAKRSTGGIGRAKAQRSKIFIDDKTGKQVGSLVFRGGSKGKETEVDITKFRGGKVIDKRTVRGEHAFVQQEARITEQSFPKPISFIPQERSIPKSVKDERARIRKLKEDYDKSGRKFFNGSESDWLKIEGITTYDRVSGTWVTRPKGRVTSEVVRVKDTDTAKVALLNIREAVKGTGRVIVESKTKPIEKKIGLGLTKKDEDINKGEITFKGKKVEVNFEPNIGKTTINVVQQREQDLKNIQKELTKSGIRLQTRKIGDVTVLDRDSNNFPLYVIKSKPGLKFTDAPIKQYMRTFDKLKKNIIGDLSKTSPELVNGIKGYKEGKKQMPLAGALLDLASGLAFGVGTAKVLINLPKVLKTSKILKLGLRTGQVIYSAGIPFRIVNVISKTKDGKKVVTGLVTEFAGDVGFLAGLRLGGISFKTLRNTKLDSRTEQMFKKTIFKKGKKPNKKVLLDKFMSLDGKGKAKLMKAYKKVYGHFPKEILQLGVKVNRVIVNKFIKKSKLKVSKPTTTTQKKFPIVATGKKIRFRGLRVIHKARISAKKLFRLNKKQSKKAFKEISKEIKQENKKLNQEFINNEIRTKRLIKRIRNKKISKAIRTGTAIIDGKQKWLTPLTKKWVDRSIFLKEAKILSQIDKGLTSVYENYRNSDIMLRTLEKTIPQNKKLIQEARTLRNKNLEILNKIITNKLKLIIHDTKNYALVKLNHYKGLSIADITKNKVIFDSGKKISKPKENKEAKELFSIQTDKGKVIYKSDGKMYIYKSVDKAMTTSTGQKLLIKQLVLVEVKVVQKQRTEQIQKVEQLQKQKVVTEQFLMAEQDVKVEAKTRQKLHTEQVQKQKQVPKLVLKLVQVSKLDSEQLQRQMLKLKLALKLKQKQKLQTKQAQKLKLRQKQMLKQKLLSIQKQQQKLKQKQAQKLKQKQDLIQKTILKPIPPPPEIIITKKPPKLPEIIKKKLEKLIKEKKLKKRKLRFQYSPTLAGIGEKASRTVGKFTGLEVRGNIIRLKPIKVKRHKRGNLKNKRFVRKHRRRKPKGG